MSGLLGGGGENINTVAPVIGSLRVQTSTRGKPIPLVYGKTRLAANLLWYGDFTAIPHTTTQSSGGKGGDPPTQSNTTWSYTAAIIMGLCEGAINSIPRVWRNKDLFSGAVTPTQVMTAQDASFYVPSGGAVAVANSETFVSNVVVSYDTSGYDLNGMIVYRAILDPDSYSVDTVGNYIFDSSMWGKYVSITYNYRVIGYFVDALGQLAMSLSTGTYSQSTLGWMDTKHPAESLAYRGIAYVSSEVYDLGTDASMQNHSFEIDTQFGYSGSIRDANPSDVLVDLYTNPYYGGGMSTNIFGDLTDFNIYVRANNIFISPAYTEQKPLSEMTSRLMEITNCEIYYSENKVKVKPYGDIAASANGASFVPDVTPIYDLTDDDFIGQESDEPVQIDRKTNADAFNQVSLKFYNRDNSYNEEVVEAKDQANIELYGLRAMEMLDMKEICDIDTARSVVQLRLQRALYIRNTYTFKLGWKFCLLEPMDIVTLTDSLLGLSRTPVRITSISEDKSGVLSLTAEEYLVNVCSTPLYPSQSGAGYQPNFNVASGNANPPIIFEPTDALAGALEIWIVASGGLNYGGCNLWVSFDGNTYLQVGSIYGTGRQGVLSAALATSTTDVDTTNTLHANLSMSYGEMISGTQDDADNLRTLCYVDGELIAYETATLTGANQYDLTYLVRGAYGTTISSHLSGKNFARIDQATVKFPYQLQDIGRTIYVKLQAYNPFGGGVQSLSDIEAFTYTIQGSVFNSPLPNISNLTTNFVAGITQIYWDGIDDFRTPIDYEVRRGSAWATAQLVCRTPLLNVPAVGDGTYWVSAHYRSMTGVDAYSQTPQSITITGAVLVTNVLATYDEAALSWPGTLTGGATVLGSNIILAGGGNILDIPNVLSVGDMLWYGGASSTGTYQVPVGHRVNVGRVAPCTVIIVATGIGQSIYDNVLTIDDFLNYQDLFGSALGPEVSIQPQIRIADATGIYGAWQNYIPGIYYAQYFDSRIVLMSSDLQVTVVLSGYTFTVDVPDRIDRGQNISISAGGTAIAYSPSAFNAVPNLQITILNAQAGDDVQFTVAPNAAGFTVKVVNAGVGVARSINWIAQGY
jgi:hypothetical protein